MSGPEVDVDSPAVAAKAPMGPLAKLLHGGVRLYQKIFAGRPSPCRFDPSCSTYALGALESHGAVKGSWLAVRRIGRCHPWGGQGYDPVPPPKHATEGEPAAPRSEVSP